MLFGSTARTDTFVVIGRLGRTYISEIGQVLGRRLIEIQRAVISLERAGVVVSNRMSEMPTYANRWAKIRRRPRAMGKPL